MYVSFIIIFINCTSTRPIKDKVKWDEVDSNYVLLKEYNCNNENLLQLLDSLIIESDTIKYNNISKQQPIYLVAFAKEGNHTMLQLLATNDYSLIDTSQSPNRINVNSGLFIYKGRNFIVNAYPRTENNKPDSSLNYFLRYFKISGSKAKLSYIKMFTKKDGMRTQIVSENDWMNLKYYGLINENIYFVRRRFYDSYTEPIIR